MGNIIDYALNASQAFRAKPFGIPDAVILAQLAYLDFAALPHQTKTKTLGEIVAQPGWEAGVHIGDCLEMKKALFAAAARSPRFKDIVPYGYRSDLNEAKQKQFSAVTFLVEPRFSVVSFRGTDSTVIGWKENFNMSFMAQVPAQRESAAYINAAARRTRGDLIVTGHSKGGNLAVYACVKCAPRVQKRVTRIYNFDGPGFKDDVYENAGYQMIDQKITTVIPQSSVVGLLLRQRSDYLIAESDADGLAQHDMFSWKLNDGNISYAAALSGEALFWDKALDEWLAGMRYAEREQLINALYGIVKNEGIHNVNELTEKWDDLFDFARYAAKNMDEETKALFKKAIGVFIDAVKLYLKYDLSEDIKEKLAQLEEKAGSLFEKIKDNAAATLSRQYKKV